MFHTLIILFHSRFPEVAACQLGRQELGVYASNKTTHLELITGYSFIENKNNNKCTKINAESNTGRWQCDYAGHPYLNIKVIPAVGLTNSELVAISRFW